ncbi:MAG TPA: TIGR03086 family metal-binding protein [Acidimicrobiales bacterium]|nr:TIGR03086 family metal-binding protein [Acidimicrobiales bacterium]
MDPIDALELSWKQGAELVAGLRPDELTLPTPCAGWDVRRLLNHTLGEVVMMTRVNAGQPGGTDDQGDLVGGGLSLVTLWDELGRDNVTSWRDGGLEGDRAYFYGTFPAGAAVVMNLGEVLVHSWDLARATGRAYDLDPELAEVVYELYRAVPLEDKRANGVFGPEVTVPTDAPVADRLLALSGRRPTAFNMTSVAIARGETAETLSYGPDSVRLLLDADATGGAISAHHVRLTEGALGANPHRHTIYSEAFYVVDGSLDVLAGEELTRVTAGDLAVVPPGVVHAFGASAGCDAEALVFITPGVERFDFFRQVGRVLAGEGDRDALLKMQPDIDTYTVDNPAWRTAQ